MQAASSLLLLRASSCLRSRTVYLDANARGRGIGRRLLEGLIDVTRERDYWKLVSRIFLFNMASHALCRSAGFREVGIYETRGGSVSVESTANH